MEVFTSPVTGAAITGLTSPTYTLSEDTAPDTNGGQQAVTALGGTQAGVDVHSVARPFTISIYRPKNSKILGPLDPITGAPRGVGGVNTYTVLIRKGVLPLSGQPSRVMQVRVDVSVPAGADIADAVNIKAALSLAVGALWADVQKVNNLALSGILA
jgi:hypothetical protein